MDETGAERGYCRWVNPSLPSPNNNEQEWDLEAEQGRVDMTGSREELTPEERFSGESKGPLFPSSPLLFLKANSGLGLSLQQLSKASNTPKGVKSISIHRKV